MVLGPSGFVILEEGSYRPRQGLGARVTSKNREPSAMKARPLHSKPDTTHHERQWGYPDNLLSMGACPTLKHALHPNRAHGTRHPEP